MRALLVALSACLALAGAAAAQTPAPPMAIKVVKPGLWMVTGGGGNVSVRATDAGLVIVDTKNNGQAFYDDLMGRIATVSPAKVAWVVDTHHHADHTGNNARFLAAGARVIGHKGLPPELDKFTPPPNNPTATAPAKPSQTYDARFTITEGGKTVRLHHFARAHTGGDTVVHFPDLKVVAMGDELNAIVPNIDYAGGGSLVGWLKSWDETFKLDWDVAIPGHGDSPMTRAEVQAFRDKLALLLERARAAVKAGATKDKLIASIDFTGLWTFNPAVWNEARTDGLWREAGGR